MNTVEKLLDSTREIWKAYNNHPFVLGIQNGNLDKEKFRYYIIQDYIYLKDYAKVFALGIAKAKNLEMANLFSKYIPVMNGELNVHKGYLKKFEVSQEEIDNTPIALDNLSYTSYMLRIAYEEGQAEILTAILACAYSYEIIAKNIIKNNPKSIHDEFYGAWIESYASDSYADDNKILLDSLNDLTKTYSIDDISHLIEIFRTCSIYEMKFWDMSRTKSK